MLGDAAKAQASARRRRNLWGWNRPARGLLNLIAAGSILVVGWRAMRMARPIKPAEPFRVDVNHAPAMVLEALPGLGPVLSGRIVEARRVEPIRDLIDLDVRIKGIGPARVRQLRPFLRLPDEFH